jgi:hypothetical protein
MAGTYPSTPNFQTVNFRINTPTLRTETMSGITQRVSMGHSFYTFGAQYNNMRKQDFAPVLAFIASQYGPFEDFQIVLPEISYTKLASQTSNTVSVATSTAIGANSVAVSGAGANQNILAAGDYFKFSNHSKVYMCVTNCTADANGDATLNFSGSLVNAVTANTTTLVITAVPFTVMLDEEIQEYQVGVGGISNMQLEFREVWA